MKETVTLFYSYSDRVDHVILLNFEYIEEDGRWVGFCIELGTSAYSDSLDHTRQELRDAVTLQLDSLDTLGHVWEFLRDNHVSISGADQVLEPGFSLATV